MERKPTRFELRLPPEMGDEIDEWRRQQADLPSRAEAARRLIQLGLEAAKHSSAQG
jgi:metal-responsive CopG/Arc/MetJ family transcriptional regulator